MESCDALIVGGGPAGSSCAARLHAAGLDVLVLDRAPFPRDKPCAGWITAGTLEILGLSPREYAEGRTLQAFRGFRTGRVGGPEVTTDYGRTVSFGIRRREFDAYLLERSGARVRGGAPVSRLRPARQGWIVNEEIRAPLVVGAGGHFCPVARLLNGAARRAGLVAALDVEFRMNARELSDCGVRAEVPELYFSPDMNGYGWCLRKGEYLNVGLGRRDPRRLPEHLRRLLEFLTRRKAIPATLPGRFVGHAYPLHEKPSRQVVGNGLILVGDAAGLAAPSSGEGIRPAIESGLLAAEAILAARGRYGREDLEPYPRALEARLGPGRRPLRPPGLLATLAGRWLLGSAWFARHMILDRWFLQTQRLPRGSGRAPEPQPIAEEEDSHVADRAQPS